MVPSKSRRPIIAKSGFVTAPCAGAGRADQCLLFTVALMSRSVDRRLRDTSHPTGPSEVSARRAARICFITFCPVTSTFLRQGCSRTGISPLPVKSSSTRSRRITRSRTKRTNSRANRSSSSLRQKTEARCYHSRTCASIRITGGVTLSPLTHSVMALWRFSASPNNSYRSRSVSVTVVAPSALLRPVSGIS